MDFAEIHRAFRPLYDQLDHDNLNEIEGLSNPTSENLANWIWERLLEMLPGVAGLKSIGLKPLGVGSFSALLAGVVSASLIGLLY